MVPATKANWALLRHYAIADAYLLRVDVRQLDLRKVRQSEKIVTLADAEKAVITAALSECKTKADAAAQLGINKSTLAAKIKKYKLDDGEN